jgi:hypothetical protein
MLDIIPVKIEETNMEVLARIVKATSRKFDCSMSIDFQNGNRKVQFILSCTFLAFAPCDGGQG